MTGIEDRIAERTHLITSIPLAAWQGDPELARGLIAAVETFTPKYLSDAADNFIGEQMPDGEVADFFEEWQGAGFAEVVRSRLPVIGYGPFITRNQPVGTARVHEELASRDLPKEKVLLYARHGNKELVVYQRLNVVSYEHLFAQRKWDAFQLLGQANRKYAIAGIAMLDNDVLNWVYVDRAAVRLDIDSPSVPHRMSGNRMVFNYSDPFKPYSVLACGLGEVAEQSDHSLTDMQYVAAMASFAEGFFSGGKLNHFKAPLMEKIQGNLRLIQMAKAGIPYELALLVEQMKR